MKGEVALLTGAAGGIGSALARRLARAGVRQLLTDADEAGVRELALELREWGAEARALRCDVTDPADCERAVRAAVEHFGGLDALVLAAGITHFGVFAETSPEVLRRVMEVNFTGSVRPTHAALPELLRRRGRIAVLSSVAGFAPLATRCGYSASKHALHGLFDSLRAELRGTGVSVTVVCPSFVDTAIEAHGLGPDGGPPPPGARTGAEGAIPPERAAEAIYRGLVRRKRRVFVPGFARLAWWVSRLAPRTYERLMLRRVGRPRAVGS